jgi:hypothetical protein
MMGLGGSMPSLNMRQGLMQSALSDPLSQSGGMTQGGQLTQSGGMDPMFGAHQQNNMIMGMTNRGSNSMANPYGSMGGF